MIKIITVIFQICFASTLCLAEGTEKKLKISLGTDDFRDLVTTSDVFVDKSLFIKEVIDSGDKAILITRPRRWGKSLALDMLKTFLMIEPNVIETKQNGKLFENLKIAKIDSGYYMKYQGEYPVIHITLKDVTGNTLEEVESQLKLKISGLFKEYKYLLNSEKLNQDPDDIKSFRKLAENGGQNASRAEITSSLWFLSRLLHKHHNQEVYILVDEYDKPVNHLLETNLSDNKSVIPEVSHLITSLLSTCGKSNIYLKMIILTGIFDSLKKEGGSGFNNVAIFGITDRKFSTHFGFSVEEVESLVKTLDFENQGAILKNIKDWYNGYSVLAVGGKHIQAYAPWAVMRYLSDAYSDESAEPQNYWVQSGASTLFQTLLKNEECANTPLTDGLLNMVESGSVALRYDRAISLFKYDLSTASEDERIFSYLLLNSGYLTALEKNGTHITLSIPNYEIREELRNVFDTHIKTVKFKKGNICSKIQNAFNRDHSKDGQIGFIRNIIQGDVDALKKTDLEVECSGSGYSFNPLQLAALSGRLEILEIVADKCRRNGFTEDSGLSLADYAYMSSNNQLFDYVQNKYGSKQTMVIPGKIESLVYVVRNNIVPFTTSVLALSVVQAVMNHFQPQNILKAYALNLYNSVLNIPVGGHVGVTWVTLPVKYLAWFSAVLATYKSYPYLSENGGHNYLNFSRSDLSFPEKYSLSEFLKYRLVNERSSYVMLDKPCKEGDRKISELAAEIFRGPGMSEHRAKIYLCHSGPTDT